MGEEERSTVPAHVDAVVRRALEKLPADRFGAAGEVARALGKEGFRWGEGAAVASLTARDSRFWLGALVGGGSDPGDSRSA